LSLSRWLLPALIVGVVIVSVVAAYIWIQGQSEGGASQTETIQTRIQTTEGLKDMRTELEGVRKILWIGPHADDEVYVAGLLRFARLEGKDCTIVAYKADNRRKKLNQMSAELLGCKYIYMSQYPGKNVEEEIRSILAAESPDLVLTFHPETGFRMNKAHAKVGRLVTEVISTGNYNIKLFYVLNKDPTLEELLGGADRAKPTHYLDLQLPAGNGSLFEVKIADICIYSDAIPAAKAICKNVDGMRTKMLKYELYMEYGSNESVKLVSNEGSSP